MEVIDSSTAQKHLNKIMDQVCDQHLPLTIKHDDKYSVVIMSLDDYNAIQSKDVIPQVKPREKYAKKMDYFRS